MNSACAWVLAVQTLAALNPIWTCPTESAARSLPTAVDLQHDGTLEVTLTTRFDGALKVIGADGALLHSFAREQWLEGCVAAVVPPGATYPLFAYQDSTGAVYLSDLRGGLSLRAELEGEPRIGTAPCFADLGGSGAPELIVARRNGLVTAFDLQLTPLWQYDSGSSFDASPAAAPIYAKGAVVYVQSLDGVVHALSGEGAPLWWFTMDHPSPKFPSLADPLVAYLGLSHASLVVSDREGWLYALDAFTGAEQWRARVGTGALGSPAVCDVLPDEGREIIVLSEEGALKVLSGDGVVLRQGALPPGRYVPRPLVADVDADGQYEVLAPVRDWAFLVATLGGAVKERVEVRGNIHEGLVLADLNSDGLLELLAATDCGQTYCFATRARDGWKHPRAGTAFNGCVPPIVSSAYPSGEPTTRRAARVRSVTATGYLENMPFATVVVDIGTVPRATHMRAVIRVNSRVAGSARRPLEASWFTVPFVQTQQGLLTLDLNLYDKRGKLLGASTGVPIQPNTPRPIELTPPDGLFAAAAQRSAAYALPSAWQLPTIAGRDSWHVVRHMPDEWQTYGLAQEPFIADAIPRVWALASAPFGPSHPAWQAIQADTKPFFVMNDYFRPEAPYSAKDFQTLATMGGPRFLGFPVHEWGYGAWKSKLEGAEPAPHDRAEATSILRREFEELLNLCHGKMYAGEGYCLFHHQAYEWGAPLCYAEIGENIPCAPLQFAFLRGAARQSGGRPWGAYLSNWFRGTVVDTRYAEEGEQARWSPPDLAVGPTCGHSPNLEFRLKMAAHLAGATFVHHESDGHHGSIFMREERPNEYSLSAFGAAMQDWHTYSRRYTERGTPYTPIAFVVDFEHGWRPREDIYGVWPPERPDRSMEALFAQVYPWGGRLDFERGYLANGPYGDIFDVITNHADPAVLNQYAALWLVGDVAISTAYREALTGYVKQGGILVVDSALARNLSSALLGVRFETSRAFATQIQSALGGIPPITAPYLFRPMSVGRQAQVLAWTDGGEPLVAWRRNGNGLVIVSGTDHWLDERNRLLPLAGALLGVLSDAFLPLSLTGDVQVLLNRTRDSWIVGLINNNGVTKTPTRPAVIHASGARECILRFKDKVMLSFTPRLGDVAWSIQAGGLSARLPPGAVAVIEVKLSGKE